MRSVVISAAFAAATLVFSASAIRILMGNDDGFGSAQLREFYRLLKAEGHDILIVAPGGQLLGKRASTTANQISRQRKWAGWQGKRSRSSIFQGSWLKLSETVYSRSSKLLVPSEFDLVPAGSPALGQVCDRGLSP